ncbi:unnamed protein product [Closterium sp. Yama58-4]|nr:unnamed protein product [Closterium sp. Yama58-4]
MKPTNVPCGLVSRNSRVANTLLSRTSSNQCRHQRRRPFLKAPQSPVFGRDSRRAFSTPVSQNLPYLHPRYLLNRFSRFPGWLPLLSLFLLVFSAKPGVADTRLMSGGFIRDAVLSHCPPHVPELSSSDGAAAPLPAVPFLLSSNSVIRGKWRYQDPPASASAAAAAVVAAAPDGNDTSSSLAAADGLPAGSAGQPAVRHKVLTTDSGAFDFWTEHVVPTENGTLDVGALVYITSQTEWAESYMGTVVVRAEGYFSMRAGVLCMVGCQSRLGGGAGGGEGEESAEAEDPYADPRRCNMLLVLKFKAKNEAEWQKHAQEQAEERLERIAVAKYGVNGEGQSNAAAAAAGSGQGEAGEAGASGAAGAAAGVAVIDPHTLKERTDITKADLLDELGSEVDDTTIVADVLVMEGTVTSTIPAEQAGEGSEFFGPLAVAGETESLSQQAELFDWDMVVSAVLSAFQALAVFSQVLHVRSHPHAHFTSLTMIATQIIVFASFWLRDLYYPLSFLSSDVLSYLLTQLATLPHAIEFLTLLLYVLLFIAVERKRKRAAAADAYVALTIMGMVGVGGGILYVWDATDVLLQLAHFLFLLPQSIAFAIWQPPLAACKGISLKFAIGNWAAQSIWLVFDCWRPRLLGYDALFPFPHAYFWPFFIVMTTVVLTWRSSSGISPRFAARGSTAGRFKSNALAALEAVDLRVAEEVMAAGCITGDRINGLCDGLTGEWYVKFDTFTPAAEGGLPVTRVISRMTLQQILVDAVGEDIIRNGLTVVDFEDQGKQVAVKLSDGSTVYGDMLVGADGIRSKVRDVLLGVTEPTYSDYTCYTGICDFVPHDIETVGYRVFLGHRQYFVSSDVGFGKMQWYAFYNEPAGGSDPPGCRKQRLMKLFGNWADGVVDLIQATPEEDVLRRDIYDRIPILQWSKGRVTLMGDAAHAMQPNMGQGGCMAIEDGFQLALDLEKAVEGAKKKVSSKGGQVRQHMDVAGVVQQYEAERRLRVGAVHGMARTAAIMASTYRAYLGEGFAPLSWLVNWRIPHWGKMGGQVVMKLFMPAMLKWVLTGNTFALEGRAPYCRITDRADSNLAKWMEDDDALERATDAKWFLLPAADRMPLTGTLTDSGRPILPLAIATAPEGAPPTTITSAITIVGTAECAPASGTAAVISLPGVEEKHCRIESRSDHTFYATDLSQSQGTWLVRVDGARSKLTPGSPERLHPGDSLQFGPNAEALFRIKLRKAQDGGKAKDVLAAATA